MHLIFKKKNGVSQYLTKWPPTKNILPIFIIHVFYFNIENYSKLKYRCKKLKFGYMDI